MRVVLDTNVLLSACWTPGGLEAETVGLALAGRVTACISEAVWKEYCEVLGRKKFAAKTVPIQTMLGCLQRQALTVEPKDVVTAAADEDDNRFLECAEAAAARYLITGNLRDYPRNWKGTVVVNAREFLNCWYEGLRARPEDA